MLDVKVSHVLVRDDDTLGIGFVVEFTSDGQASCGGRGADQFDDDAIAKLSSGLARQFWVMNENRRCSILFHLLVPGGR